MLSDHRCQEVVTGLGLVTAIGSSEDVILAGLRAGTSGIRPVRAFDTFSPLPEYVAEVTDVQVPLWLPTANARNYDPGTHLAAVACAAALANAGLPVRSRALAQAALYIGTSGNTHLETMCITAEGGPVITPRSGHCHARSVPHFQATTLSSLFGIQGPVLTICNASASGGIALALALRLLRSGRADLALVGSGEALTLLNTVALSALRMSAAGPCKPFGDTNGLTLGAGAAFLVLERRVHAERRGARILAELLSAVATSDGCHAVANDPTGRGLCAAFRGALTDANLGAEQVDWIKTSGTGVQAQDRAESFALAEVYAPLGRVPPVVCLEPVFGHPNAAAPLLGLATAILCMDRGVMPKAHALNPKQVQLPHASPPAPAAVQTVAANAMGFGGSNVVAVVARPGRAAPRASGCASQRVAIVGTGVVSPYGAGVSAFQSGLYRGARALSAYELGPARPCLIAACVPQLSGQHAVLWHGARRLDRLRQFALTAASEALADAGLAQQRGLDATALLVAMARGPVAANSMLLEELCKAPQTIATGRLMLDASRFSIVSELCTRLGIHGLSTSLSGGIGSGLQALLCGVELLRADPRAQYALVVAVDELAPRYVELADQLRLLSHSDAAFAPYARDSRGMILGEGAVAFVLQRLDDGIAAGRTPRCVVAGTGMTSDGRGFWRATADGSGLARAARCALADARCEPAEIAAVCGNGHGLPAEDTRELTALRRVLGGSATPLSCVTGHIGVAEATSSLFATAALATAMDQGQLFPMVTGGELDPDVAFVRGDPHVGEYRRALVLAATEDGNNAAAVLERLAH